MSLEERFTIVEGRVYLSGIDALVRLPIDQHRRDARAGLRTATFISGYPGSPLAGYDLALKRAEARLREHDIVHHPAVNEDLAATEVYGSQLFDLAPRPRYDGVLGIWYGKSPGVDRCGDAFKHANFVGTSPNGGVLVLGGDDHTAKSSTLPCQSDYAYLDAGFPILYPGNVQEVLDLGAHGFALSRFTGAWVALKLVTNICDGGGTVAVTPDRPALRIPDFLLDGEPYKKVRQPRLLPPFNLELEREVHYRRLEAACAYARANALNRVALPNPNASLGIVTAGKSYYDTRQSLTDLGLDDASLVALGIRILKVDLIYPLERATLREFARGLKEILVVEEKRAFLETQVRDALYNVAERPRVIGKRDEEERELFPIEGELDADIIAAALKRVFERRGRPVGPYPRAADAGALSVATLPPRMPGFCSGCPHNTSTVGLEGRLTGYGIGCHLMSVMRDGFESFFYVTQMGGEGAPWIAIAPFSETKHVFQNLGDGTYFHSGALALKDCVSAGVNITYKLLYNDAIAMTGGQASSGALPIPDLTRQLAAEGVREMYLVTEDTGRYRDRSLLAPGVRVYDRSRLEEVLSELEKKPGVTMLIYDQMCAKKKRKLRGRRLLEDPSLRVMINEEVCEGCGDCGVKSNCLSVRPVETEFGRKTRIDQGSCNKDYSCLKGDCPSFVTVHIDPDSGPPRAAAAAPAPDTLPAPAAQASSRRPYSVFFRGIGGTGVVTANALVATAAAMEGKHVLALDQTGLAQMGGAVTSHLILCDQPFEGANKVSAHGADLILGFDILGAAAMDSLKYADSARTAAVVNTGAVPTSHMVRNTLISFPDLGALRRQIDGATAPGKAFYLDAGWLSRRLFGKELMANILCLGAAYQAGHLPVGAGSLEEAIRLNGVEVGQNLEAFRWGRQYRIDPQGTLERIDPSRESRDACEHVFSDLREAGKVPMFEALAAGLPEDEELRKVLRARVAELILYQDAAYAREYCDRVREIHAAEERLLPGRTEFSATAARYLYKLMAYKDEYEVARLLTRRASQERIRETFGKVRRQTFHLHPPALRALGLKRKLRLPAPWIEPLLRVLYRVRRVRGTRLDIFGRARLRVQERELIRWYNELLDEALARMTPRNYKAMVEIASLPDQIRGYEQIKLDSIVRTKGLAREKLALAVRAA